MGMHLLEDADFNQERGPLEAFNVDRVQLLSYFSGMPRVKLHCLPLIHSFG